MVQFFPPFEPPIEVTKVIITKARKSENTKSLNFKQAMVIIMGANIGTNFSSQLIALNINVYALIPMIVGFFIWLFSKSIKRKRIG